MSSVGASLVLARISTIAPTRKEKEDRFASVPPISTIERVDGSKKKGFAKIAIPTPQMVMNTRRAGDKHFLLERGGVSCDDREYASQTQIFRAFWSDL